MKNSKVFISPSVMCCHLSDVKEYITAFEEKEVMNIHFDVMDGHYVNNIMLGVNYYQDLCAMTKTPIDLHFMCQEPERFIDYFNPRVGDWVSFHPETTNHPHRLLQKIHQMKCRAGIVLNPSTPISYIEELGDVIDFILVMAVNPGFAGQKMVSSHLSKLSRIRELIKTHNLNIQVVVDGNTTIDNAKLMVQNGADGLVVGTSSLLKSPKQFLDDHDSYIMKVSSI